MVAGAQVEWELVTCVLVEDVVRVASRARDDDWAHRAAVLADGSTSLIASPS